MKYLSAIVAVFFSVLLGTGSILSGGKASVKEGKALFNDPELGSTGSSCNTCHTDGRGSRKGCYSIVTGLRGNALNVESVEMQSLVLYIKSLGGKKAVTPKKAPVSR
jgi:hypothetical protein